MKERILNFKKLRTMEEYSPLGDVSSTMVRVMTEKPPNSSHGKGTDALLRPNPEHFGIVIDEQSKSLMSQTMSNDEEKWYYCKVCYARYTSMNGLKCHERKHNEERLFKCKICEIQFTTSSDKISHEKSHLKHERFQCEKCPSSFTKKSSLRTHEKTHLGLKPFKCQQCPSAFTRTSSLRTHEKTHLGLKP